MNAPDLTAAVAGRWRVGVPTWVFTFALPVSIVAYLVLTWDEPVGSLASSADELLGFEATISTMAFGFMLGMLLLVVFAPRLATLVAAVGFVWDPTVSVGEVEWAFALAWVGVLVVDLVLRSRQRQAATWRGRAAGHRLPGSVRPTSPARLGLLVALVIVSVASWLFWTDRSADFSALEARSEPGVGVIVSTKDGIPSIRVEGKAYDFYDDQFLGVAVGDEVAVMVDPTGAERPYGPGDIDPDGWGELRMLPGLALAGLLSLVVVHAIRMLRAGRELAAGSALRARLSRDPETGQLVVLPLDSPRPVATLASLHRLDRTEPLETWRLFGREVPWEAEDEWDSDEEDDGIEGFEYVEELDVPTTLHGLDRFGDPIVLEVEIDGEPATVAALRVIHPTTARVAGFALLERVVGMFVRRSDGRRVAGRADLSAERVEPPILELAVHQFRSIVRWAILPLVVAIGWLAYWFFLPVQGEESSWAMVLFFMLPVVWTVEAVWTFGAPTVRVVGPDLVLADGFREEIVDVRGITELRLRADRDYLVVDVSDDSVTLHASLAGSTHAVDELTAWHDDILGAQVAHAGQVADGPVIRRRFSASVGVALLAIAAYLAGVLAATGGQLPVI